MLSTFKTGFIMQKTQNKENELINDEKKMGFSP